MRLGHPLGQLDAMLGGRAQRGEPPGEQAAGGPLGLEQRAQGEQMVAERLVGVGALAAQLEAPQRPRELVAVGRAPRDEVAEGAQLVLLLGGDDEHPVRAPARTERERCSRRRRPMRAQASAPSVTRPSPNRRSARSRSRSTSRPSRWRVLAR